MGSGAAVLAAVPVINCTRTVLVCLVHGSVCLPWGSQEAQAIHPAHTNISPLLKTKALFRQIVARFSAGGFKLLHTTSATAWWEAKEIIIQLM